MKEMSAKEVESRLDSGEQLNLIDVREVEEVQEVSIPGIVNIPLRLLEFRMHELDKNKPYIMVCRSSARSSRATQLLEEHGYDVTNMVGGMLVWEGKVD